MSFSMGINQGTTYLKNTANKLLQGFKSKTKEGFDGILGKNNDMANLITGETIKTGTEMNNFNNNIAQYGTAYDALVKKTDLYLNDAENSYNLKKNYNVFISKSSNQEQIKETNQLGCATAISTQASIKNITYDPNFLEAYPNNFTNYADANAACKLWAADTGSTVYAVNQNDNGKDFRCYVGNGLLPNLIQYTKPNNLYTLTKGDKTTTRGGLFANGQIGAFSNTMIDPAWNVNAMPKPNLVSKFNSTDYSDGTTPTAPGTWGQAYSLVGVRVINDGSVPYGWGKDIFPNNKAWWLSGPDWSVLGTVGFFYYAFENPIIWRPQSWWSNYNEWGPKDPWAWFYIVCDDKCELKVNGEKAYKFIDSSTIMDYGRGGLYFAQLKGGKNAIEVELINTGGPSGFVLYSLGLVDGNLIFMTGPNGWGYSKTRLDNYNKLTNAPYDKTNPFGIYTANKAPTGYEKCHPVIGGRVNMNSIQATYGKNCSGKPMPGATSCHGWDCPIEGQKCYKGTPGMGSYPFDWRCHKVQGRSNPGRKLWSVEFPANIDYKIKTRYSELCLYAPGKKGEYGEVKLSSTCPDTGQKWNFRPTGKLDTYMIHNTEKDVCLFANADGRIGVAPCNQNYNDQLWQVVTWEGEGNTSGLYSIQLKTENSKLFFGGQPDGVLGINFPDHDQRAATWRVEL